MNQIIVFYIVRFSFDLNRYYKIVHKPDVTLLDSVNWTVSLYFLF